MLKGWTESAGAALLALLILTAPAAAGEIRGVDRIYDGADAEVGMGWRQVSRQSVTAPVASIDLAFEPAFERIQIEITGLATDSVTPADVLLQVTGDNFASVRGMATGYSYEFKAIEHHVGKAVLEDASEGHSGANLVTAIAAGGSVSLDIALRRPGSAAVKSMTWSGQYSTDGAKQYGVTGSATYGGDPDPVNGVRLIFPGAQVVAGDVVVWGRKAP